ncbi:type II CAAX prenyl endopeptidase Rce1 family protein [Sphingosinicella sp. BN140058]|uniref:CPBP family glutamic-type intramembrane protease n=1 Tax=Sphingosinicella sp. BN140058 TaxID=1892855 RepID=UPI00101165DE|nr:CPBP family intramembrane metalloprotease [Sphingosinicella sp. BN140058]QAY76122.1 CPBP family intramembrane metalloprotease [Sphingosinicella sp. BN140058]
MRRWQVLLAAGAIGVASLLLVPFESLVPEPIPPFTLRLLAIINPALLTAIALLVGELTARRIGLGAPLVDAWLQPKGALAILRRQLPPALIVGVAVAAILVLYGITVGDRLIAGAGAQGASASFDLPLAAKLLYGGIVEELITRWGLVSLIAWLGWRVAGRPERLPRAAAAVAIIAAAGLFAAGHLPLLFLIAPDAHAGVVVAVLAANALPGILLACCTCGMGWRRR